MTPGYWWEREMGENIWTEITRRDDIGADLNAPAAARGGGMTASYVLRHGSSASLAGMKPRCSRACLGPVLDPGDDVNGAGSC